MTATEKPPTAATSALVVRMPLHGRPARLVSMFGLLVAQFTGDSTTVESDAQETMFFGLLRKRILKRELSAEALVGAYLHSIGTMTTPSRALRLSIDGGNTEFKLIRNGCSVSLELRNRDGQQPEMVLRFEGPAKRLATIGKLGGDLGATLNKKIWTGKDGERSASFATAFDYWFQKAVQFESDQKLG